MPKCTSEQLQELMHAASGAREWLRCYNLWLVDNPDKAHYLINYVGTPNDVIKVLITALSKIEEIKYMEPKDFKLNFEILENGNLKLTLNGGEDVKKCLAQWADADFPDEMSVWFDAIEHHLGNGWSNCDPESVGAMTSDPYLISDDYTVEDNDTVTCGHYFYYPDYALRSIFKDIAHNGYAIMQRFDTGE